MAGALLTLPVMLLTNWVKPSGLTADAEPTPNARVRLSRRASEQVRGLSAESYLLYEDALVELSVQLAMGEAACEHGCEHMLEYEGCTMLYRPEANGEDVLVDRVFCNAPKRSFVTAVPAVVEVGFASIA